MRLEVPSLLPGSWEAPRRGLGRTAQRGPSREELLGTGAAAGHQGVWSGQSIFCGWLVICVLVLIKKLPGFISQ